MTEHMNIHFEDFTKICRFCCKKSDSLRSIFEQKYEKKSVFLWRNVTEGTAETLFKYIGLRINSDDELPESLCTDCDEKILSIYNFRKQCELINEYLYKIVREHKQCLQTKTETSINDVDASVPTKNSCKYAHENDSTGNIPSYHSTKKRNRGRPPKNKSDFNKTNVNDSMKKRKKLENRQTVCLICGKMVNHNIKGHQAIHDTSEKFECDICGFQTYVKLYLKNHMKKKHIAQRQYKCSHCHLIFMHAITLKRHTTIHTGERNHVCEECGKSYRQRDMLAAHRKRHLPPTIQCPHCDKLFYSKNELKSHVGIHTGVKAFKCDICTAAFVASSSLAAHRRQHRKQNLLPSCKLCNLEFKDRLTYNMHLMDHKRLNQSIAYNSK